MAKLLYDYWFVQFDFPDENGKPYKSSGGKMVWNEELKREIPAGWDVSSFEDCVSSVNTGLNPRDNFKLNIGGKIRYLTVKNLTKEGACYCSQTVRYSNWRHSVRKYRTAWQVLYNNQFTGRLGYQRVGFLRKTEL